MDMNDEPKETLKFLKHQYNDQLNFSVDDYLFAFGKESQVILSSILFFPELIEIENSVFLKKMVLDKEKLKREITESQMVIQEVEASYNYIEVGYLFNPEGQDISDQDEYLLAKKIMLAWNIWLKAKYPRRKFAVQTLDPTQTGSTVGVQFYELRE